MKNHKILTITIACFLLIVGCTEDFEEVNRNPNAPTVDEANPALVLPKILFETGNHMTASMAWNFGNVIAQLVSTNNFTGTSRYLFGSYTGTWNLLYRNIRDANNLIEIGKLQNSPGYEASGMILRAWMVSNLTDMYGDVPLSEGLRGKEDIFQPSYDRQEDIYRSILSDLEEAIALLEEGGQIDGDIMYGGDLTKWAQLARCLQLRYLLRLEKKWGEMNLNGAAEMQRIYDGGQWFASNADNAAIPYLEGSNRWPLHTTRIGSFDEKRMSERIEQVLKDFNDPRMPILFRPADNPDSDEFLGIPNGLSEDAASNFNGGANNQSRLGTRFREEPATVEMIIMHHAELMFILAEAQEKGYINTGQTAENLFKAGIESNLDYYGVSEEDKANFLSQEELQLDGSDNLEKILTQKWLSLFMVGNEAWYNFKRTSLPPLTPGPDAVTNELPSRIFYPDDEQVRNTQSYQDVIERQGPNEITTRPWLLQ